MLMMMMMQMTLCCVHCFHLQAHDPLRPFLAFYSYPKTIEHYTLFLTIMSLRFRIKLDQIQSIRTRQIEILHTASRCLRSQTKRMNKYRIHKYYRNLALAPIIQFVFCVFFFFFYPCAVIFIFAIFRQIHSKCCWVQPMADYFI